MRRNAFLSVCIVELSGDRTTGSEDVVSYASVGLTYLADDIVDETVNARK